MPAPQEILQLVQRFDDNVEAYCSAGYNETQVRIEFIDPFFKALGWDIDNRQGFAEAYKDVIHEDAIKIGGATKAPDYCFRVGGTRKFFLEAKRPGVHLKKEPEPAYQLRRYAWSAGLPLSILTNFAELAVYDCRGRPSKNDKASVSRTLYLTYREYADQWDTLAGIFAREAVYKGSFDKYAESNKAKRGTAGVDAAFLEEIEIWRERLARNFALRNANLSQREVNYAVQATIDPILFLRMCEDRGIEVYGQLLGLTNGPAIYPRLFQIFRNADDRYNSGLFYFHSEPGRDEPPDELTPSLKLDDKPLKEIITSLYYPESPYEFSVLSAEILGQVYERFLGKVIRLTEGYQAKIEEKPEVRKAGGVYYTPTYIVDYIVKNTVGKLLEGKTPRQASRLKILDPACGSSSFLLGAYQCLLDWHRDRYVEDGPGKHPKELFQGPGGIWRLTTGEKRRILVNNIFGVDIDPQAVEVTKLSLLLKVLEGESKQTLEKQYTLYHERALPDLASNIKCGNSLIGPDFYEGQQGTLFDEEERYRINVFDWELEFPAIMKGGGFDVVIGNPPYGAFADQNQMAYYRKKYDCVRTTHDSFALFMEKSAYLLQPTGLFGMIVQSAWVSAPSLEQLREVFISRFKPTAFATMPYDVFRGAYFDTVIAVAERLPEKKNLRDLLSVPVVLTVFPPRFRISSLADFEPFAKSADAVKWVKGKRNEFLVTLSEKERQIVEKIESLAGGTFADVADIQRGVTPFAVISQKPTMNPRPAFTGTVRRYKLSPGKTGYIRYDETLAEFKPERYFRGPRLLLRELISRQFRLQAAYTDQSFITNKSMQSLLLTDQRYHIFYLLGLLNSALLSWYFLATQSVERRDDFPKIVLKQTRELPFRKVDFSVLAEKGRHDEVVGLAQEILLLNGQLLAAKTAHEQVSIQRQIAAADRRFDRIVCEQYGLSKEEIKIVEEGVSAPLGLKSLH